MELSRRIKYRAGTAAQMQNKLQINFRLNRGRIDTSNI